MDMVSLFAVIFLETLRARLEGASKGRISLFFQAFWESLFNTRELWSEHGQRSRQLCQIHPKSFWYLRPFDFHGEKLIDIYHNDSISSPLISFTSLIVTWKEADEFLLGDSGHCNRFKVLSCMDYFYKDLSLKRKGIYKIY